MLRTPHILRFLAAMALACGSGIAANAQAPPKPAAPAKSPSKAPAAQAPQAKAPAAKAPAAKAPAAKAPAAKAPAAKAPTAKAPAAKAPAAKAPAAKAPSGKAKASKAAAKAPAKPAKEAAAPETAPRPAVHRRDPFASLISPNPGGPSAPLHLPPGIAGLMVSTLRVDGVVRAPNGMLAVVTNPQQRTYFVRQGARLYDGTVEQISMDGVSFKEMGKDPFGHPIERIVTKRIYPTAGE